MILEVLATAVLLAVSLLSQLRRTQRHFALVSVFNFFPKQGCSSLWLCDYRLPRQAVESSSLEVLKHHIGVTLRYMAWW